MKQSIGQLMQGYNRFVEKKNADAFSVNDLQEVKAIATDEAGNVSLFTAITVALNAGFMAGYRAAQ